MDILSENAEKRTEKPRNVLKNNVEEQKKRPDETIGSSFFTCTKNGYLCLSDSANRACASAGTAVEACALVDYVAGIALRDSANRALCSAGTTADASITNLVSHETAPPRKIYLYSTTTEKKNNSISAIILKEIRV